MSEQGQFIILVATIVIVMIQVIAAVGAERISELDCVISGIQVDHWAYNCLDYLFKEDKKTTDVVQLVPPPVGDMVKLYRYFK